MSPAQPFDFAAELEIATDSLVIQYAEAVNHRQRATSPFDDFVRIKLQIRGVRHSQYDCLHTGQRFGQVALNPEINQAVLIAEKPCP